MIKIEVRGEEKEVSYQVRDIQRFGDELCSLASTVFGIAKLYYHEKYDNTAVKKLCDDIIARKQDEALKQKE